MIDPARLRYRLLHTHPSALSYTKYFLLIRYLVLPLLQPLATMFSHWLLKTIALAVLAESLLPLAVHAAYSFQNQCLSFKPEAHVYNSSRHVLAYVPAGTNLTFPDNDPTCARPSQLVAVNLCRVALSIPTSNRSSIVFELWLPENWSGRFLATGSGGIDGCEFF